MNIVSVKSQNIWRVALIDVALLATACLIPTLSHLTALPLYQLNPMLMVLLAGMLLVRDPRNAYIMAVLLPVVSMLAVGMPTPMKALCMVPEMLTVVLMGSLLMRKASRFMGVFGAMVAAILCGKVVYYGLKALIFGAAGLVSTPILVQVLAMVGIAAIFAAFSKK